MPAITICFDKIDVLNDKYLRQLNIPSKGSDKYLFKEKVKIFCANYTIRQQFEILFMTYEDIINLCVVSNTKDINSNTNHSFNFLDYFTVCDEISPVKTSIDYHS